MTIESAVRTLFAFAAFCAFGTSYGGSDYAKRLDIVVAPIQGETGLEQTDLPVLVRLSPSISGFRYADFNCDDGADMVFTDETGTVIPHEIDTWDTNGTSLVWVKLPRLHGVGDYGHESGGATITCSFGGDARESSAASVWAVYTGVWHMGATNSVVYGSAEYAGFPNATGLAGTDGIITGETKPSAVGVIGGSADIATVKSSITKENGVITNIQGDKHQGGVFVPAASALGLSGSFSFSCWVRQKEDDFGWQRVFGNLSGMLGFNTDFKSNGTLYNDNYGEGKTGVKVYFNDGKIDKYLRFYPVLAKDEWHHLVFVFDQKNFKLYEDGVCIAEETAPKAVSESEGMLGIGNYGARFGTTEAAPWGGYIDEFRIHVGGVSAARIAAEYETVANPSSMTYGTVRDTSEVYYPVVIDLGGAMATYDPEPHHLDADGNACFLSGTEVTVTVEKPGSLGFRGWSGDVAGAVEDGESITLTVAAAVSLVAEWKTAWTYYTVHPTALIEAISDGSSVIPVSASDGSSLTVKDVGLKGTVSSSGVLDFTLPITDADAGVYHVTRIYKNAFTNVVAVKEVRVEEGLAEIGESAFSGCSNLTVFAPLFPDSLVTVGNNAFKNAPVAGDAIGRNVTSLGNAALQYTAITSASFPSAAKLGSYTFANCTSLTNVDVSAAEKIHEGEFYQDASLQAVTVSTGLVSIGQQAFRECPKLETVTPFLPATVSVIGKQCFQGCTSLRGDLRIECPELTANPTNAFQNSASLNSIYLPHVVTMGGWVYGSLGQVTNITLSADCVTFDGSSPFSALTSACEVYFPGKAPVFQSADRPFGKGVHGLVIYCDPTLDPEGWERVAGLDWVNSGNSKKFCRFESVADHPSLKDAADYPGPKTIGRFYGEDGSPSTADSYDYWLVRYRSPNRKLGLTVVVR